MFQEWNHCLLKANRIPYSILSSGYFLCRGLHALLVQVFKISSFLAFLKHRLENWLIWIDSSSEAVYGQCSVMYWIPMQGVSPPHTYCPRSRSHCNPDQDELVTRDEWIKNNVWLTNKSGVSSYQQALLNNIYLKVSVRAISFLFVLIYSELVEGQCRFQCKFSFHVRLSLKDHIVWRGNDANQLN